jgi:hypothetical protein
MQLMIDDTVNVSRRQTQGFSPNVPRFSVALSLALAVGGCITYSPQELTAMSSVRLCEMQLYSRVNLNNDTKARLQDELRKRNEDCRQYVAQLEKQRADDRETAMYNLTGP